MSVGDAGGHVTWISAPLHGLNATQETPEHPKGGVPRAFTVLRSSNVSDYKTHREASKSGQSNIWSWTRYCNKTKLELNNKYNWNRDCGCICPWVNVYMHFSVWPREMANPCKDCLQVLAGVENTLPVQ